MIGTGFLTDEALEELALRLGFHCTTTVSLIADSCKITDAGIRALVSQMTNVFDLTLSFSGCNRITDAALDHSDWESVAARVKSVSLNLEECTVTNKILKFLKFENATSVKVAFKGNAAITDEGISTLITEDAFPVATDISFKFECCDNIKANGNEFNERLLEYIENKKAALLRENPDVENHPKNDRECSDSEQADFPEAALAPDSVTKNDMPDCDKNHKIIKMYRGIDLSWVLNAVHKSYSFHSHKAKDAMDSYVEIGLKPADVIVLLLNTEEKKHLAGNNLLREAWNRAAAGSDAEMVAEAVMLLVAQPRFLPNIQKLPAKIEGLVASSPPLRAVAEVHWARGVRRLYCAELFVFIVLAVFYAWLVSGGGERYVALTVIGLLGIFVLRELASMRGMLDAESREKYGVPWYDVFSVFPLDIPESEFEDQSSAFDIRVVTSSSEKDLVRYLLLIFLPLIAIGMYPLYILLWRQLMIEEEWGLVLTSPGPPRLHYPAISLWYVIAVESYGVRPW